MPAKILIVEDEAITAIDIKNTLKSAGFEVVSTASEGNEAIQKAGKLKPDLILMDIFIKGEIDGIEAASKIMNSLDIPIIYLTAYSDKKTLERAKLTEAYGFITKPFNHDELIGSIEIAIYKHKLDKKIKENEKLYHEFFDNPITGFALCKIILNKERNPVDFVYLKVNKAFEEFTGLKREEVLNKRVTEVLVPEEVADIIKIYGKVALTGETTQFEYPIPSLDKIFNIAAFSPRNMHFIAIFTDITEQKKADERLKESEARFRSLYENSFDGILLTKPNGTILAANHAAEKMFLMNEEEIKKLGRAGIVIEDKNLKHALKEREEKCKAKAELTFKRKDGSTFPVEVTSSLFKDIDGTVNTSMIIRDISERKQIEEDLRQVHNNLEEQIEERTIKLQTERNNLNNILNTTKSGVYIVNKNYELEYVNSSIKKDFGLTKGQKCYEYFYNEPNICFDCKIQKVFEGNITEWEQHSSKSNKTYDAFATPIKTDGSISVVVFLYDVTRRENAEEQLKEAIQELERSNMELRSFAYITSHDLQEPLRTIGNYAGLIDKRYKGQLDCDADEFLDYMVSASKRMKDMIQGLLDYSRINRAGKEFIKTNMNVKLEKAIVNLQYTIDESKAEITHDELPTVISDQNQMVRVFQNLIGNAIKFKKPDKPPKIHISVFKDKQKNEYVFSVSDNGIGMETQYTNKIFEVFKRLHTIDEYEGTGIGLAIVKRIIERHGGRVWVESSFGVGSTFYFTIPIEQIKI